MLSKQGALDGTTTTFWERLTLLGIWRGNALILRSLFKKRQLGSCPTNGGEGYQPMDGLLAPQWPHLSRMEWVATTAVDLPIQTLLLQGTQRSGTAGGVGG